MMRMSQSIDIKQFYFQVRYCMHGLYIHKKTPWYVSVPVDKNVRYAIRIASTLGIQFLDSEWKTFRIWNKNLTMDVANTQTTRTIICLGP